ncbi:MAG: rod shape-determining protein MreD [Puniceicoccaceae bacterium]
MSDNGRISLIFLLNLILYFVAGEINFLLETWSLRLHLDALLILFFGLHLNRISSLVYTAILGFLADSIHPAPEGTYVAGYLFLWLLFVNFQRRIRRQNRTHVRAVAAGAQAFWLLALAVFLGFQQWDQWIYWQRILLDLFFSAAVVYALAWPWCYFQKQFLYNLGWDLESEISRM